MTNRYFLVKELDYGLTKSHCQIVYYKTAPNNDCIFPTLSHFIQNCIYFFYTYSIHVQWRTNTNKL